MTNWEIADKTEEIDCGYRQNQPGYTVRKGTKIRGPHHPRVPKDVLRKNIFARAGSCPKS